jgi:hypothetical protein
MSHQTESEARVDGGGAAAAAAPSISERVDDAKSKLAALLSHEEKLDNELRELEAARNAEMKRVAAKRKVPSGVVVTVPKALQTEIGFSWVLVSKRKEVRAHIEEVKIVLDAAVNAPVSGGRDPTQWLPDELMLMVLERLPLETLWSGSCKHVCKRWLRLMIAIEGRIRRAPQARRAVGGVRGGRDQATLP